MTPRQREQVSRLQRQIAALNVATQQLQRAVQALDDLFETPTADHSEFTAADIDRLLRLNQRLAFLEHHLQHSGQRLLSEMTRRVADSDDPMDDFELDVILHFMLRALC